MDKIISLIISQINHSIGFVSKEVLFWTLSTIVQSFVAFVSLLGMVVIYRIQMIQRSKENLAESMRDLLRQIRGKEALGYPVDKIVKDVKGLSKDRSDLSQLTRADLEFSNFKKDKNSIKKTAIFFFCSIIFLLFFSLALLPISPFLEHTLLGLLFLSLIIFGSLGAFILGLKLLIDLL